MMVASKIQYVHQSDIDAGRWDDCISRSSNGLIYSTYQYLTAMTDNWDAVILGNYEAVLPLPFKKKLGIRYTYHPLFIQQLGITGLASDEEIFQIMELAFKRISFGDFLFNYANHFAARLPNTASRSNLVLNLENEWSQLQENFQKDALQNARRAAKLGLTYSSLNDLTVALNLYENLYSERLSGFTPDAFENLKTLANTLQLKEKAFARTVLDKEGNILATALFFMDNKRIYNLANATTQAGRQAEANYFMMESLIKEFANRPLVLDFEGSDLPGVKAFYEKFGAINQPYFHHIRNSLPPPLKWMANRRF